MPMMGAEELGHFTVVPFLTSQNSSSTILFTRTSMCLARLRKRKVFQMTQLITCLPHFLLEVAATQPSYIKSGGPAEITFERSCSIEIPFSKKHR